MADLRKNGATSNRVRFTLKDKLTGQGKTGLSSSTSGLIISTICDNEASATTYTQAGSTIETISTLGTFAAPTATKCRFKEVDATNHKGLYEFQFADARFAVSNAKRLVISVNDAGSTILDTDYEIDLNAIVEISGAVTLADGVAHGGTPGSSTATLALQAVNLAANSSGATLSLTNVGSGNAATFQATEGAAMFIHNDGSSNPVINISSQSGDVDAVSIEASGAGHTIALYGSDTGSTVRIEGPYTSGPAIEVVTTLGHAISILAIGSDKKALLLAGDAATDALAIAAGAGSPIDIFNADGTVNVAGGGGSAPSAATVAAAVWDEILTGATHNINNSAGKKLRTLAVNTSVIYTGTAPSQAGMSSTQIKFDSGASSTNNVYQWDVVSILSGTDAGDSRIITGYTGSTKVATVNAPWTIQPDATSVFEITPTAATQVVSYITGQDPATLVWAAATRTLTALPAITANWLTADGLASDAVAEIQSGLSTYAGGDTSGVTTLLSRLTSTRAGNLDRLDTTVSSRSTYAGEDTAGTQTLLARLTSTRASHLDNLDAAISTLPTEAEVADALLGRNIAGGSDGGRTVSQAFAFLRNKWAITAGTLTVYETNDSSTSWTAAITTSASNPIIGSDPT